ncbi:MAG: serine hydrolase, partial [Bacteroidota bacterium]
MKKIWLTILTLLAFYQSCYSQSFTSNLDSVMRLIAKDSLFHGQVLIAENKEVVFHEAYGKFQNGDSLKQITKNTPFNIASVTKAFTAVSVLILFNDGKLTLQDELTDYFPQLPYKGVSLYNLLTMTSGLPRFLETVLKYADKDEIVGNQEIIEYIARYQPASGKPGVNFNYNNSNYLLLASIIEKVSGVSYQQFIDSRIFKKLQMKNSYVITVDDFRNQDGPINADNFYQPYGEGNIYSTAADLYKFEQALYADRLLPQKYVQMLFRPTILESGDSSPYGLAWKINTDDNQNEVRIIGDGSDTRVSIQRFLSEQHSLIYVHAYSATNFKDVYPVIKNIWRGLDYVVPVRRKPYSIDTRLYEQYIGKYLSPTFGLLHVTSEVGKLYIRPDPVPGREELIPSTNTTFYFGHQDLEWEFFKDEA